MVMIIPAGNFLSDPVSKKCVSFKMVFTFSNVLRFIIRREHNANVRLDRCKIVVKKDMV